MAVAAQRQVLQGEIARLEASRAATLAEKQLELQRLQSQISAQGRTATMTRMAELQQIQAQQTREITALEQRLAVTTVATSEAVVAAHAAQTAAVGRQAAATAGLTAAQAELATASRAAAAAQVAGLGVGRGLLGLLGGPMGLGVLVASVAAGWLLMRDNTDQARTSLEQIGTTAKPAGLYLALFSGATAPAANWGAASFAAVASEIVSQTEGYTAATRPVWTPVNTNTGSIDNLASVASLTIATASQLNVTGAALLTNSTRGGTTGAPCT